MKVHHLIAVVVVLVARLAVADDAATHVAAAKKAFAENRFADAIAEFRAANAIAPDPKYVYSIAQAQRMAGDCAGAIVSYEEFIKLSTDAKLVEFSKANITRCKEIVASQKPEPKPEPKPDVKPEPGPEPAKLPVEAAKPVPHDDGPPNATWTRDWLGHALVTGGVGLAVVGTVVWLGGRSDAAAANDATDHDTFIAKRDAASSAVTKQRIGIVMGLAGVTAIGLGVVHYTRGGSKREAHVTLVPTQGGGAVVAGGAW